MSISIHGTWRTWYFTLIEATMTGYFNAVKSNFIKGTLQWRHNGRDSVSNHQLRDCFLNRFFRRRSKKISKLRVAGLCVHKWPVTRKMFPFDDVIMQHNYNGSANFVWSYTVHFAINGASNMKWCQWRTRRLRCHAPALDTPKVT